MALFYGGVYYMICMYVCALYALVSDVWGFGRCGVSAGKGRKLLRSYVGGRVLEEFCLMI
jgi:hypothetical protein